MSERLASNEDISGRTLSNPTVGGGFGAPRTASISFGRHSGVGVGSLALPGARFADGSIFGATCHGSAVR
jgi:dTDP-4-amino-4,6-dideoxy-D-glucose acyltransferase